MTVILTRKVEKIISKLPADVQKRIVNYLSDIADLVDPRSRGKRLTGHLSGFWRHRVGNYRIICRIIDNEFIIVVIGIGHRRDVYDK